MEFGNSVQISEADVDPAFEQSGILTELGVLGTLALIQQVAGIKDGLNLAGKSPESRESLSDADAERRIVIFQSSLIRINRPRRIFRNPSIDGG